MKQNALCTAEELNIVYYSTLFLNGKIDECGIQNALGMSSSTALVKARDIIKAEAAHRGVNYQEATAELLEQKKFKLAMEKNEKN
ncbi:hypothetical protein [Desulfolucanica intricata]|uniref:hypothetical protein n=1 Tax=Desulfolucanica intricata TaxID=1285191 RepID=UPI000836C301|nr:hypothetical protein [Desulfolucanica intricata]